jgi:type IX secretion system PorP/SprF family membrane protein
MLLNSLKQNFSMKKVFLLFLFSYSVSQAQNIIQEHYQFNQLGINPAFAGAKGNFNLNVLMGNQFNGTFRPFQISQILTLDGPINRDKGGLGFQMYNDRFTGLQSLGGNLSYAHRFNLGEVFSLAIGLQGGFVSIPASNLRINNTLSTNYGAGLLLQASSLFLGISMPIIGEQNAEIAIPTPKPLYSTLGASFGSIEGTMINPNVTLITGDIKGFHLNAKAWFKGKTGVGISLRNENESSKIILTGEYQVSKSLRLGLSYDSKAYNNIQIQTPGGVRVAQIFIRYQGAYDNDMGRRLRYF